MTKRKFLEMNGYPCAPDSISSGAWFYTDPKGLLIVTHPGGGQGHISWAQIKRALDDRKKAPSRRRRSTQRQGEPR